MVKENLENVKRRIKLAAEKAGRDPISIKLLAVTKEAEFDQIKEAIEAGISDVGENRVKDAVNKKKLFDSHVLTWHMIGHLQSNKVKDAVKTFSLIHSVDSLKLACVVNTEAGKEGKTQDILLEVNVSGEGSKFGIKPEALSELVGEVRRLKHVNLLGLMTMAPFCEDPEKARPYFKKLKELSDKHGLKEISMGMTQDFEVAIEEGATIVRIGSAIFK